MAGPRGRTRKTALRTTPARISRRGKATNNDPDVPEVFQDLLSEARASKAAGTDEDSKPLKKRKTARLVPGNIHSPADAPTTSPQSANKPGSRSQAREQTQLPTLEAARSRLDDEGQEPEQRIKQTVTDSEESEDSDIEWEDALLEDNEDDEAVEPAINDLSITLGNDENMEKKPKGQVRRRGITSIDKKRRLDVHKMHLLCLLYHVHLRNAWCNDERVQATLRRLPSPKTLSNLVPNPEFTQYQSSKRFIEGMGELRLLWSNRFSVTALGMHKPRWIDADAEAQAFSTFDELDDPMDKQDFRKAASSLRGSQDVGAQLFCALLRGIGIEARLVCSLQVLPFQSAAQASTPQKTAASSNTIFLDPYNTQHSSPPKLRATTPARPKKLSRLERILGERSVALSSGVAPKQHKKYHTAYPVYWIEAFNPAVQKWVTIDPLSTLTVDRPDKLEPPLSYPSNTLVYAVAFEEDLTAKDVTRRYAKAYNAKTRKFRVECTKDGTKWWKRALKVFRRATVLDRDQVEDAALARKEAAEGMPKNVQDFKDHPVYVLERHLRHNEVIHPMHQVGKVNVASAMNPRMEPIYRRQDVHLVRSADKWYRMGRDVRGGEQPLKHAKPKKGVRRSISPNMNVDPQQEETGTALYASFQTELYIPPPVVRGKVPRNGFGNLDVYVPSMIPKDGIHIRHKLGAKAARIAGVDYADAVTGFSFKGRHGTAIVQGVIVAQEYAEAVETVIDGMEFAQQEAENSQRSAEALRLWRRFFLGLRIAQRVNAIEIDGETGPVINVQDEIERQDKELAHEHFAGGFFPDETADVPEPSPSVRRNRHIIEDDEDYDGVNSTNNDEAASGFISEYTDLGEAFVPHQHTSFGSSLLAAQALRPRRSDDDGGFIPEEDEVGGGFIHEQLPAELESPPRDLTATDDFMDINGTTNNGDGGFVLEDDQMRNGVDGVNHLAGPDVHDTQVAERHFEPNPKLDEEEPASADVLLADPELQPASSEPTLPPPSSLSEAGSLPLEDPEDEDADPEWLVDVT